jgi:anionic cell wall polymer biosynthesis LytR-Cps2A-Psr (LCP) family protein
MIFEENQMKRKWLAVGISIIAVVLLILGSLSNVVGYQTVQSSNQNIISNEIDQKELPFQTIVDIANNKEIQRIILKSQLSRGQFPVSNTPVLTKNQLKQMYFIGLLLSKIISKSRMQSMVQKYQVINPEMQHGIKDVIEKNPTLKGEITQLSNSDCECENENTTFLYFPVLCTILLCIFGLSLFLFYTFHLGTIILIIAGFLITLFQCILP